MMKQMPKKMKECRVTNTDKNDGAFCAARMRQSWPHFTDFFAWVLRETGQTEKSAEILFT